MTEEQRKVNFFKRASKGYLLKLYRSCCYNYFFDVSFEEHQNRIISLCDMHWSNEVGITKYIKIPLLELKKELEKKGHYTGKIEAKKKRMVNAGVRVVTKKVAYTSRKKREENV